MALSLQRYMKPETNSNLIQYLKDRSKKERESSKGIIIADAHKDRLDDGLIVEILSWLPVRWLMQYKSVCKAWHAIISSPNFASKHLKNYYRNRNDYDMRNFFVARYYLDLDQYKIQAFVMAVDDAPKPRVLACEDMVDMPLYVAQICGPCDGLYYLYLCDWTRRALWNPAINELRELPPLEIKSAPFRHFRKGEAYGLAYDHVTADYKVVVIAKYRNTITDCFEPSSVAVYSFRNDCWKYCGDLRREYNLEWSNSYNFINGWYYWVEYDLGTDFTQAILGFNVATDECEEIKLPDSEIRVKKSIGIYDDCLALLTFHENPNFLKMWTLKDGIWVMKLQVGPLQESWEPIGQWTDNKFFINTYLGRSRLGFLDLESQDIKELSYETWKPCQGVFLCGESLVSVKRDTETSESDSKLETLGLQRYEASETDSDYGIRDLFYSELSESDSEYGIDELFCHEM